MIEAKELRIGNWVRHKSVWSYRQEGDYKEFDFQWSGIDWYAECECRISFEDIEPIPITEEWLLRFAFRKTSLHYFKKDGIILSVEDSFFECFLGSKSVILKHIHHLQNVYFALTNNELELK